MKTSRSRLLSAALALPLVALAACGSDSGSADGDTVKLTLAHSYTAEQPQAACGADVIKKEAEDAGVGLEVEVFANSQLGGDADRIASVQSGDIDVDIQGASALAAVYEPVGIVDAAYAFDSADHLKSFFGGPEADQLKADFKEASKVSIIGAWSAGARQFTANEPIREPADLDGLRMRFPGSPQFLANAKALGARATEVAYEELYLALQQGVVDGQENPITNIAASNLVEVQGYISMSSHAQNSNLIVVGPVFEELDAKQQDALTAAVDTAVDQMPGCVEEAEKTILDKWAADDSIKVVDDVDTDAFSSKAEDYFKQNLKGDSLSVYEAIRASAP